MSPRRREGGRSICIEIPRRGGKGPGGPGRCLPRIGEFGGGGGLNVFFRGRNVHQGFQRRATCGLPSALVGTPTRVHQAKQQTS